MIYESFRFTKDEALAAIAVFTSWNERVDGFVEEAIDEMAVGIDHETGRAWLEFRRTDGPSVRIWMTGRTRALLETALIAVDAFAALTKPATAAAAINTSEERHVP